MSDNLPTEGGVFAGLATLGASLAVLWRARNQARKAELEAEIKALETRLAERKQENEAAAEARRQNSSDDQQEHDQNKDLLEAYKELLEEGKRQLAELRSANAALLGELLKTREEALELKMEVHRLTLEVTKLKDVIASDDSAAEMIKLFNEMREDNRDLRAMLEARNDPERLPGQQSPKETLRDPLILDAERTQS